MRYLFLNFADNIKTASKSKIDFYNKSLEEQYENILRRIPSSRRMESLEEFMECCFPSGMEKKYYISCPNFLRERRSSNDNGPTFLNNVVIRPELTIKMKTHLPDGQNIIIIGDISEGNKLKCLKVKGLQLIDATMSSEHDIIVTLAACNVYTRIYDRLCWKIKADLNDTYFTPNSISEIVDKCYTVSNPSYVRETYEQWNEYFKFRKYYLDEQSKKNFLLDEVRYLNTYAINRKQYKSDSVNYDDHILEGKNEFKQGDMIILDSNVNNSEPFPLISLKILRNKKEFNNKATIKGNKTINEEERSIRSLANDNVIISEKNPNENDLKEILLTGYELGDKFKIIKYEIIPEEHISEVIEKQNKKLKETFEIINARYEKIIKNELDIFVSDFKEKINKENEDKINKYVDDLNLILDNDVKNDVDKLYNKEVKKIQDSNKKLKKEDKNDYNTRLEKLFSKIDLKQLYIKRNDENISKYQNKLNNDLKSRITELSKVKEKELAAKYDEDKKKDYLEQKKNTEETIEKLKNKIIEDETLICFNLLFKPNERREIKEQLIEKINRCKYICYDPRAEKAKLFRQEMALLNLYSGNVKNPYLSTYLFDPQLLKDPIVNDANSIKWHLESLNDKQKEAVRKALSSNGIFLLQGPPGTGKTQVIAEIIAHLVKDNKKVLISSETHKAIDNVFERMPKIAEIIPIRLMNSKSNKESEFTPKNLVDNFYINITENMMKIVDKYKNFQASKENFEKQFAELKLSNSKLKKSEKTIKEAQAKIEELSKKAKIRNNKIKDLNDQIDSLRINLDVLNRTKRYINKLNLELRDDVKKEYMAKVYDELSCIFSKDEYNTSDPSKLFNLINNITPLEVVENITLFTTETDSQILKMKKAEIINEMNSLCDEFNELIDINNQERYEELKKEAKKITKQLNEQGVNTTDNIITKIFKYDYIMKNLSSVESLINEKKAEINLIKNNVISEIENDIEKINNNIDKLKDEINILANEIRKLNEDVNDIEESNDIQDIKNSRNKLETYVDKFFKDFSIVESYKDIDHALKIIEKTFIDLEENYEQRKLENEEKIPMYEKISNYLQREDIIKDNRRLYTQSLFENANVFGITCTSSERYTSDNNSELGDFNLEDIDIKSIGIDVVIIDEVSKSSFVDLLIPMLYGKTVILVGDHRQLPPMYEFSKLREEDFDNLDENIINVGINNRFAKMYEECFFKKMFELVPNSFKTMLVQQYRCHEHIMNVFNHFYQGQLTIGKIGQNNEKKHNIEFNSNGRKIIERDKHIYFVNCNDYETRDIDSTSIYNVGEARVTVELLKKIKLYYKQNQGLEKLSIGVICTYGDQAKKIKDMMRYEKIKLDDFSIKNEKFIISTVDDFQGDERDIIILSTVRNPQDQAKSNPGFILAYQRINVALSRARKLLIVVGNRDYLEKRGVISNLPDVNGDKKYDQKNFRVYEEIINTIETYGKVLDDNDILEIKEVK